LAVKDSTDPADPMEGKMGITLCIFMHKERRKTMTREQKKPMEQIAKQRLTVTWNGHGVSGNDTGHQSFQMMGAAESGCCRQSGSPCSPKKFS
jgi:hypothetical protein